LGVISLEFSAGCTMKPRDWSSVVSCPALPATFEAFAIWILKAV